MNISSKSLQHRKNKKGPTANKIQYAIIYLKLMFYNWLVLVLICELMLYISDDFRPNIHIGKTKKFRVRYKDLYIRYKVVLQVFEVRTNLCNFLLVV
jgi:hypothetical protein